MTKFFRWLWSLFFKFRFKEIKPNKPVVVLDVGLPTKPLAKPTVIAPIKGYSFNPMRKYPRNEWCYCRSGKKFKKCCMVTEPKAIPKQYAETASMLVKTLKQERIK